MMPSDLFEVCDKLLRDAGSRKVMLCGSDGEVLAHAGTTGSLDDPTSETLAAVVADVLAGAGRKAPAEDLVVSMPSGVSACGASIGERAVLVVLFDESTSLERVRTKMRRAREQLLKSLPAESAGKSEPS